MLPAAYAQTPSNSRYAKICYDSGGSPEECECYSIETKSKLSANALDILARFDAAEAEMFDVRHPRVHSYETQLRESAIYRKKTDALLATAGGVDAWNYLIKTRNDARRKCHVGESFTANIKEQDKALEKKALEAMKPH